ncbi:hypothetical protein CERSUDRAFT_91779 [Gelatoporia subvermispora B]|uniref:Uncharacterized protein n=1 Tax=Ceriporiopsis subvermispora (strain B) TaxID=914234 RepID=M2PW50_CERS8|nr:hypothetical protein CERSUDRAFT_91779 [Gelatoporia subvermispora B]
MYLSPESKIRLIPRPSVCSKQAFSQLMDLPERCHRIVHMQTHLRQLIRKMLDMNIPYALQDPDEVEEYRFAALETYPFLKKFEDGWPAIVYLQRHLVNFQKLPEQRLARGQAPRRRQSLPVKLRGVAKRCRISPESDSLARDERADTDDCSDAEESFSLGVDSENTMIVHPNLLKQMNKQDCHLNPKHVGVRSETLDTPMAMGIHCESSSDGFESSTEVEEALQLRASPQIDTTSTRRTTFLERLALDMPDLYAKLSAAGLDNLEYLDGLARWTAGDREMFYREEMDLSLEECNRLNVALREMLA